MGKCKHMRKEGEGFEGSRIASVVWLFQICWLEGVIKVVNFTGSQCAFYG